MEQNLDVLRGALKSKTVWLNVCTIIIDYSSILTGVIPPGTLTAIVALANIGVRFLTVESLKEKGVK